MNRRKGSNYLTVFPDLITKRVLFGTPGKDASVLAGFAAELLRHNGDPKAIHTLSIEVSVPHVRGVRYNFGNARVVSDKFNAIQNLIEASERVRKAVSRADAGKRDLLLGTRWMCFKNWANWTEKKT